jgi:formate dehydrogenase major subunit
MTNSFGEFENAKMFFCIGTNMLEAHPVAATFLKNAVEKGARLIMVDPRRHRLAEFANMYAQIKVGTDIAFLNGLMHILIKENLYDRDFVEQNCTGFEEFSRHVLKNYPPAHAAEISGVTVSQMKEIAYLLASIRPCMVCYTLGITEHTCGRNNVVSVANLQMLLGNVGVEGGGVNPLRGQNNVQGACDMGALPNVYPGYQQVSNPAAKEKFEKAWRVAGLPDKPGIMIPTMLESLPTKKIKGLYIFGENMANSEPDITHVEHCLESAEFIVCNEIFPTETTRFADIVFPAAAWSEDDGTFTNSERRVSRVRKIKNPPGEARPNWWIFKEIAKRMGHEWESSSAREIWDNEVSVLAPSLAGIKYRRIEESGLQWPCPNEDHPGLSFLHKGGKFSHGKGIFSVADWTPPAEVPDTDYPFALSTGRRLYQYHTRTQTARSGMDAILPEETADISHQDAKRLNIADGEYIQVRSRRGEVTVKARLTEEVPPGMVWMAFHFRDACANWLTNAVFDPITLTAEYKACAVNIGKKEADTAGQMKEEPSRAKRKIRQ